MTVLTQEVHITEVYSLGIGIPKLKYRTMLQSIRNEIGWKLNSIQHEHFASKRDVISKEGYSDTMNDTVTIYS